MGITKIHFIKSTLNLAIDYIIKSEKTDEKNLVFSYIIYEYKKRIPYIRVFLTGNNMVTFAPIVSVLFSKTRLPPCILIICSATNKPIP